jgi:ribosomal protein S18 acetylase RimI-like enzyme
MASWTIETATPADDAAVVDLWSQCGLTRPWNDPLGDLALARVGDHSVLLVARAAGAVVGSAMVGGDGHRGWIYYLAVAPDLQRSGLGRELMAAAEDWVRRQGLPKLQLMVRDGNDAAAGFYAALGYELQPVQVWGQRLDGA